MDVLLTGATGFIGKHLIPRLISSGYRITCLIRNEEKGTELVEKYHVKMMIGDITEPETLKGLQNSTDYVIHLAAMGHVSAISKESYRQFVNTNEGGTKNLIAQFNNSTRLKKFIHFSSTAAMGPIGEPILNENSIPNPITPYQKSKYRSEQIVKKAYEEDRVPTMIIRPCMVYGPGGYGEFYKFCRLMKRGIFPKVGLGQNLTPMVFVEDVVSATMLALAHGTVGEEYIIASDQSIPMDELHRLVMKSLNVRAPYVFVPSGIALIGAKLIEWGCAVIGKEPPVSYRNIKSTITDRTFDISKAREELGYMPHHTFNNGIKETVEWYKSKNKL